MLQPDVAIVHNRERFGPWLERLGREGLLAVDTETTGLNWLVDRVGGLCLASGRTALYADLNALGPAVLWLEDQIKRKRELTFHPAKFDMHMMEETFGLRIPYPVHDTNTLSFLWNNLGVPGHHLKDLATEYVDPRAKDPQDDLAESIKRNGGKKGEVLWGDPEPVGYYGAMDGWWTLQLTPILLKKIRGAEPAYEGGPVLTTLYENERWLTLALRDMESRGILMDLDLLEQWRKKLEKDIQKTEAKLAKLSGKEILWTSHDQLREVLFEDMGLEVTGWTKGGKKSTPKPSTDEVALLKIKHPIGEVLLRHRDLTKQHSTYALGLLNWIGPDGRIHTTFNQNGARTGRLSAKNPNLQQVPRESGARKAFIPDRGLDLWFADYSQIEMRFAAHKSDDPTLIEGFRNDPDFDTHGATAMKMWGMSEIHPERKKLHKRRRKFAKIMNFGMLFGAGLDRITSQLLTMVTAQEAKQSIREFGKKVKLAIGPHRQLAQLLRSRYFKEFSGVKKASYREAKVSQERGYTVNEFGRRRYFDDGKWYKAFNTVIQGSAADQARRGIVALYRELQSEGQIALVLQIHDEAVYLAERDPIVHRRVIELLTDMDTFKIPITADLEWSTTTWQDKKGWHDE